MKKRVAINGYGRIGRCLLRAIFESGRYREWDIVAVNDLAGAESAAHATCFDSTHGRFQYPVTVEGERLCIQDQSILVTASRDPIELPWRDLGVDLVFECTGKFTNREGASTHLAAGAKKVLISAPGKGMDATIVYGVNHEILSAEHLIVSNASCTTNCLAPVVKPLHDAIGIRDGLVNTIHAYTKDQLLLDGNHRDLRRARSATQSIIPTKTGATEALGLVFPALAGKLDGFAMRVPTLNVSVVDLTFTALKKTSVQEVNEVMVKAKSEILDVNSLPLVSCDFNHHAASAIFDVTQTKVMGDLVKVIAWYDNEWGFSNRMLDTGALMMSPF